MNYMLTRWWLEDYPKSAQKEHATAAITDTKLPIRGIPMPPLRKTAKRLRRNELPEILAKARWDSFEEVLLLGLAVAYAKLPLEERLVLLRQVLPHMDSWAHTDSIAPTLKLREEERVQAWDFAMECLDSSEEYTVRFGVILILTHFLGEEWVDRSMERLVEIRDDRYYVQMAVAWCMAEISVRHREAVMDVLRHRRLDRMTHNKTIQKMRDSFRIDGETKAALLLLKRKEKEV